MVNEHMTPSTITFLALIVAGGIAHMASGLARSKNTEAVLQNVVTVCIGAAIAAFTFMFLEGTLYR